MVETTIRRSSGRVLLAGLLGFGAVWLGAGVASATDYGNWQACQIIGISNHEPSERGGLCMASASRDSSYAGDYYGNLAPSHPMNDQVRTWDNGFTTLNLRSFRNANYNNTGASNGTSCLGHGFGWGPYTTGNSDGLSSFRSC